MIVLTGKDAGVIRVVFEIFKKQIDMLRENTDHPPGCGCKDCDEFDATVGYLYTLGKE